MEIEVQTASENKLGLRARLKEHKGSMARHRSELVRPSRAPSTALSRLTDATLSAH